jgi:hypothetical protein
MEHLHWDRDLYLQLFFEFLELSGHALNSTEISSKLFGGARSHAGISVPGNVLKGFFDSWHVQPNCCCSYCDFKRNIRQWFAAGERCIVPCAIIESLPGPMICRRNRNRRVICVINYIGPQGAARVDGRVNLRPRYRPRFPARYPHLRPAGVSPGQCRKCTGVVQESSGSLRPTCPQQPTRVTW